LPLLLPPPHAPTAMNDPRIQPDVHDSILMMLPLVAASYRRRLTELPHAREGRKRHYRRLSHAYSNETRETRAFCALSAARPSTVDNGGNAVIFRAAFVAIGAALLMTSTSARAQTAPPTAPPAPASAPSASTSGGGAKAHASSTRSVLVPIGASLFALPYLASAASAASAYGTDDGTSSSRAALWIPAVGPFIQMGSAGSAGAGVLLALDGLAQVGGLTMLVYGLASPPVFFAPSDDRSTPRISLVPLRASRASGAALFGIF
jgi:hypothetical protein